MLYWYEVDEHGLLHKIDTPLNWDLLEPVETSYGIIYYEEFTTYFRSHLELEGSLFKYV
jgi:hypothetical protein